ncbi:hypothetical protein Tco_0895502 [Tanacetum coccineum]|uniref:Uncharacterized protein n=1 Tax=Tanacetum coccineum TaxID=301880 RepID=A0ABQ5CF50_9ASTR
MVMMVPYEAFACRYGVRDVVLRESYKPKTHEERVRLLISSPGASLTPSYSPGPSNLQAILQDLQHLKAILWTFKKCRVLKLQALAWKDNVTRGNSGNVWICQISQEISQKRTRERMSDQEAKDLKAEAREIMPQPSTVNCKKPHSDKTQLH